MERCESVCEWQGDPLEAPDDLRCDRNPGHEPPHRLDRIAPRISAIWGDGGFSYARGHDAHAKVDAMERELVGRS